MKQEIDLTKITEEQVWRLYCLAVRISTRQSDIYETAANLIMDVELTCKEEEQT